MEFEEGFDSDGRDLQLLYNQPPRSTQPSFLRDQPASLGLRWGAFTCVGCMITYGR